MISHAIWTSIAKKPFRFVIFHRGGGGGGGTLASRLLDQCMASETSKNMLQPKLLIIPECENRCADQNACILKLVSVFVVCMQQIQAFMNQGPYEP